ncbi:MAG: hypothetical protein A3J29_05560 [Acidobacteria bacterium RIFCSPLOWO2_12_FULL_67_14b]|nr:MAG: hypothetical protein A3J29_05560 [Acidobacteria bacterium RIFCSPLOWO2_12_FULL_67_14b]
MRKLFIALAGASVACTAAAETLTIGVSQETSSAYPNWWVTTPNQQVASHIYNNLVQMNHQNRPTPGLAESWSAVDDKVWEFKLRKGVKFHDGTPFTADQVISTFEHAKTIEGVGAAAGAYVRDKTYKKVDDYTLQISAGKPYPLLPNEMSVLYIYAKPAPVEDFNAGKANVGTGPYKFVEWVQGDRFVMQRNDAYWGDKPEWDRVVFKPIKSDPTRVAALLNGDVDMIDQVPPPDVKRLKDNAKLRVVSVAGERIIMMMMDSNRDVSPFVLTNDGKPFFPNPLRKWEVRKAISKAVDRNAIVERVMEGNAVASGQIATIGMFGHNPDLKPEPYDPDGARKLLAQVGLKDGFRLTAHCPNDRYINDEKICQAIAGMLTRVGIKTEVTTFPKAVYFSKAHQGGERKTPGFSFFMLGFGTATGETMSQHWMLVHTWDFEKAWGHSNDGRFSNGRIDAYLEEAIQTLDEAKREKMIQEIGAMYMQDQAIIPLHYQVNIWAMRNGITYQPRLMEVTHAMGVTKVK